MVLLAGLAAVGEYECVWHGHRVRWEVGEDDVGRGGTSWEYRWVWLGSEESGESTQEYENCGGECFDLEPSRGYAVLQAV